MNGCHLPKDHRPFPSSACFFVKDRQVNGQDSVRSAHMIGHHNGRLVAAFHLKVGPSQFDGKNVFKKDELAVELYFRF